MRSPRDSMAADIADTRSSSTPAGNEEAMIKPSTDTTADASTSGVPACKSRKRSTICSVRDFGIEEAPSNQRNNGRWAQYTTGKKASQTERIKQTRLTCARQAVSVIGEFSLAPVARRADDAA